MNKGVEIQNIIFDYFKDTDDKTLVDFISLFSYRNPTDDKKIHRLLKKFLKENGVETAYINYSVDIKRIRAGEDFPFFRASHSERDIINNIDMALLSLGYNRLSKITSGNVKIESATNTNNKRNFNYIKKTTLEIFNSLNSYEHYMYGKEEDEKIVNKITNMKYE